ncbi:MAG: hypothetical protein ACE369_11495 [Roseovarius sp.]
MLAALKEFATRQDGAVTVDWIVVCAAVTMLCLTAIDKAHGSVGNLAAGLEQGISRKAVEDN